MNKMRLPPSPQIDWKADGTPESRTVGDIYFSVEDGLEEARAVFLAGCGLPERWSGREQFGIGEFGFGTGLNFLAAWLMWRTHRPSGTARLDFVSFEGFPLERADAERALSRWPDLGAQACQLIDKWPVRMRGVQRIAFSDGVSLTLHVDDISEALPRADFQVDAWFLDGFAPAKNSAMWDDALYPQMLARSNQGARVGTYTVAGAVRRGLSEAGFTVSKAPGFGRKRERLEAVCQNRAAPEADRYGLRRRSELPSKIAVIGAGIAGACMARKCMEQGGVVTVFDEADGLGAGASGNRLALVMPRLDVDDTVVARSALEAYICARSFYCDVDGVTTVDVQQFPRGAKDFEKFAKLRADPPLDETLLGFGDDGRLIHKGALVISPDKLLPELLVGATLRLGARVQIDVRRKEVNGERFDAIVLASGMAVADLEETSWLPLTARLGQVEYAEADQVETSAIAAGHYGLAVGEARLWGASFEPFEGGEVSVSDAAKAANADALDGLGLSNWLDLPEIRSRAGVRATTPDKLPICGAVPEFGVALDIFASERKGVHVNEDMPCHDGVFVSGGLGSRGFGFAPLLADILSSQLFGRPLPTEQDIAAVLSPVRFLLRGLKRGQF